MSAIASAYLPRKTDVLYDGVSIQEAEPENMSGPLQVVVSQEIRERELPLMHDVCFVCPLGKPMMTLGGHAPCIALCGGESQA